MTALAIMIRPTDAGWAVCLTDGQELIRYRGLFSKRLALRYLQRYTEANAIPSRYRNRSESS
jgi:hypothetical protein